MKNQTFEMNGKLYKCSLYILNWLRKYRNNPELLAFVFDICNINGEIEEVS